MIVASLFLVMAGLTQANAGIIPGRDFSPDVTAGFVSAQYDGSDLVVLGYASQLAEEGAGTTGLFRGVYNPLNLDPDNVALHPSGDVAVAGVNVPHSIFPMPPIPLQPGTAALFRLDAAVDSSGNLSGGNLIIHGARSSGDERVTLLKATLTQIDTSAFNSSGHLEFLANVTQTHVSMPDFGSVVGVKINSLNSGLSFGQTFTSINMASANIGRPVPEPSSIFAMGATLLVGVCAIRKRKKAAA